MVLNRDKLKYVKKEMVYDCISNRNEVMVIELNAKLFYKHNKITRRFFHEFPEILSTIKHQVTSGQSELLPGNVIINKVKGHTFCFLINSDSLCNLESVKLYTSQALMQMRLKLGRDKEYISGLFSDGALDELKKKVNVSDLNWSVYLE